MIRNVIIVFVILIILYIIVSNIQKKEYFCDTTTDSSYNEYQDVLNDSQKAQITQMIVNQSQQILGSTNGKMKGPRGKTGPKGDTGGTYVGMGRLATVSSYPKNNL